MMFRCRDLARSGVMAGLAAILTLSINGAAQVPPAPEEVELATPAADEYARIRAALAALRPSNDANRAEYEALQKAKLAARQQMKTESTELKKQILELRRAELRERIAAAPTVHPLGFDVLSYPFVTGSTSTQPLGLVIACRQLGAEYEWRPGMAAYLFHAQPREREAWLVEYALFAKESPREQARLGFYINQKLAVHIGTHNSYRGLIARSYDLALLARRPTAAELQEAADAHVELDVRPVARDAFVFITNKSNTVRALTTDQLKAIFGLRTRNWEQVGGADAKINAYQREPGSGSQELMLSHFMKGQPLPTPETEDAHPLLSQTMSGPYNALTEDVHGIAYSVYYYEHFMAAHPYTRTVTVDGVRPTYETIRTGIYPYWTEVYCVIRTDEPPDSSARRLRDWLLTAEGQAVVAESGYVPLPR